MSPAEQHRATDAPGSRWRVSIATALAGGFGLLIVAAAGTVLYFSLRTGLRTSEDLVADKTALIVESVGRRVNSYLRPARDQVAYLARLISRGDVDPTLREALFPYLEASLAATPQVSDVMFIGRDRVQLRVHPGPDGPERAVDDRSQHPAVRREMARVQRAEEAYWGPPTYVPPLRDTVLNVRAPVRRDGEFLGAIVAAVTIGELSRFLASVNARYEAVPFILLGRTDVIAHHTLSGGATDASRFAPLPEVADIDDPVLREIWNEELTTELRAEGFTIPSGFDAHRLELGNRRYVFVYERLYGLGELPWIVGCYFPVAALRGELKRLQGALVAGLVVTLIAIVAVLVVARRISGPIQRLGVAAERLEIAGPREAASLAPSRLYEIDSAAKAFNAMTEGLRDRELMRETFGKYVPESVAGAILSDRGVLEPHTAVATILFTDIAGFSTISEQLEPAELIAVLNEYFSVVVAPIERHGGVIHQFQGDGILVTYNLPVPDPDHAAHAVATALEIQDVLAGRRFTGGIELPTRVGVNTGEIVGGTVGASGRLGYTVHGDDVNVAARIQELNKQHGTWVLVGQSTVDLASDAYTFEAIGEVEIRGRSNRMVLHRVTGVANRRV